MKTRLLFLLALTGLCCQPLQAASYYAKKAFAGAATLGYWGALYYDSAQMYKARYEEAKSIEKQHFSPPSDFMRGVVDEAIKEGSDPKEMAQYAYYHWYLRHSQADPSLVHMIHKEAIKKGLDPKKIICIHNGMDIGVYATSENMRSLFTQNGHFFAFGPRYEPGSLIHTPNTDSLPYFDEKWKIPIIQHELNHIKYRHQALTWGAKLAIPFAAHLLVSRAFRLPFQLLGAAYGFRPTLLPHITEKILLLPTILAAKTTWRRTGEPLLQRYKEKQADLNIDDDPKVIKGFIDWLENCYESDIKEIEEFVNRPENKELVKKFGKETLRKFCEDKLYKNATHPHPLERIDYLTEKLHEAEKQKEEAK